MLIVLFRLLLSVAAVAVGGHPAVAQDQAPAAVANQAVVANPNLEEVPKRVIRAAEHVVHLDTAKLEDTPSLSSP